MNNERFNLVLFTKLCEFYGPHEPIHPKYSYISAAIEGHRHYNLNNGVRISRYEAFKKLSGKKPEYSRDMFMSYLKDIILCYQGCAKTFDKH